MIYRYTHTTPACWKCPLQGLPLGSFHIAECSAHEGGMGLCLAILMSIRKVGFEECLKAWDQDLMNGVVVVL